MGTQIRVKMEELQSIFSETKNALALSHGAALIGREAGSGTKKPQSAVAAWDEEEDVDHVFILRKASLNQEQWNKYLSEELSGSREVSTSGSSKIRGGGRADSAVSSGSQNAWAKRFSRDVEGGTTGSAVRRQQKSIFGLPLQSPLTRWYTLWTNFILFLDATYTAFLVPVLVGFKVSDVNFSWGCYIDLIAGCMYFIELCLGFHIGFMGSYNSQRKLVMDGKGIARYYVLKGNFFVDMLASVAWIAQVALIIIYRQGNQLSSAVVTSYQIIRILRLVRFMSLLRRLYATAVAASAAVLPGLSVSRAEANFFNLIYGGAVLANFLGCLWNFTAQAENYENTWMNYYSPFVRQYGDYDEQSDGALGAETASMIPGPHRYLVSLYYVIVTIGTVGYGDILPANAGEIFISIFIMCVGLVFFGLLLGAIATSLQQLSKDAKHAAMYRARMENVDKWMDQRHLPKGLRQQISKYYAEDWLKSSEAVEEVQIMEEVPQMLRKTISLQINKPLFVKLGIFHDFPDKIQTVIAGMMYPVQVHPGLELCDEDDTADCCWILHEGEVSARSQNGPSSNLRSPALLGQTAILQEQSDQYYNRPCAYRAHSSCLLWELPMRDLLPLLRQHPTLYAKASQQALPSHLFDYLAISPAAYDVSNAVGPPTGGGGETNGSKSNGQMSRSWEANDSNAAVPVSPFASPSGGDDRAARRDRSNQGDHSQRGSKGGSTPPLPPKKSLKSLRSTARGQ